MLCPLSMTNRYWKLQRCAVVNFDVILSWMEYIRNNPENAYRFSENFWQSQIDSKKWLLEHVSENDKSIVIYGGWYGVLAQFIAHKFPSAEIVTTDLDFSCAKAFNQINHNDRISFRYHDMKEGTIWLRSDLVINTSSEHIDQDTYDAWWNAIPDGTKYIVQGNNLVNPEHVRLADTLDHFLEINHIENPQYAGMLRCGHFYRFMAVGIK